MAEQKKYFDLSEELQHRITKDRKNGVLNPSTFFHKSYETWVESADYNSSQPLR